MNTKRKLWAAAAAAAILLWAHPGAAKAAAQGTTGTAAVERPIQVYVGSGAEEDRIRFGLAPYLKNDVTLVPFRPVFERLGLAVDWDEATRTVTGTSGQVSITLQLGSRTATVNGKTLALDVAPELSGDSTFVPLRFVGEAMGLDVNWDGYDRSVLIAPIQKQLEAVFLKAVTYQNTEDLEGYMSLVARNTYYKTTETTLAKVFADTHLQTELKSLELVKAVDGVAIASAALETKRIDGGAFQDRTAKSVYVLHKTDGTWRLAQMLPDEVDFMKASVYQNDKPVVQAGVLEKLTGGVKSYLLQQEKLAASGDAALSYTLEGDAVTVLQANSGRYLVRFTQKGTAPEGSAYPGTTTELVAWLKLNAEGQWEVEQTDVLKLKYNY